MLKWSKVITMEDRIDKQRCEERGDRWFAGQCIPPPGPDVEDYSLGPFPFVGIFWMDILIALMLLAGVGFFAYQFVR